MRVVELSGGVGGARLARGLAAIEEIELTVVVNVGDDEVIHGLQLCPDLDTVVYTMASMEGGEGWGRSADSFVVNDELARFGVDNRFRIGDLDLALNLYRTERLAAGESLSSITSAIADAFGLTSAILPVTDDRLRTQIEVEGLGWISFQEYFVLRQTRDQVSDLRFEGATKAAAAPGVLDAIAGADVVLIAPSNPPLSIWPILAVAGVREAVAGHPRVVAVSPLIGGKALKGPAVAVLESLGLPPGNRGVAEAYAGLIERLVIDRSDAAEALHIEGIEVTVEDTLIGEAEASIRLGRAILLG
jgi:LPPG:FO 2-phospho-L-lactate transferase